MKTKRSLKKSWAVSEKLEVVQARLKGLTLEEVSALYGISANTVGNWARKYDTGGIAGLEAQPTGSAARTVSPKVEAAGLRDFRFKAVAITLLASEAPAPLAAPRVLRDIELRASA